MNVEYLTAEDVERGRMRLRLYTNSAQEVGHRPDLNFTSDFDETQARRIARAIAAHGGFARIRFGDVVAEYGSDPRRV